MYLAYTQCEMFNVTYLCIAVFSGSKILSCLTGFEPQTASEWFVVRACGGAVKHGQHVADEFVVLEIKLCAYYYLSVSET